MSASAATLVDRYNVPGPRYTSYPTVPYWEADELSSATWLAHVRRCLSESDGSEGISLYIHLPYCETPCTFCGCIKKFTRDHAVEAPYVADVLSEWRLYLEQLETAPQIRELHIGGGTPTFFSASNLSRLMSGILDRARVDEPFDFSFEGNPSSTTDDHLRVMHEHGFGRVSLGVQDFDPVVQQTINRVQPFECVAHVTETARQIGYSSVNFDLIYGLPRQSEAGMRETMQKVLTLRPDRIAFYGYAHVPWHPGASQRRFSESEIPRGERKQALYGIGRDMLMAAGYERIGMDHFALPEDDLARSARANSLHRNFMGYTPMHTRMSIGLGMSAIGDAWYAFAQNEKTVDAYRAKISAGELPVFRGHVLSDEDLVLRRLILDIMCRGHTDLSDEFHELACASQCLSRLQGPRRDGLVEIEGDSLTVTDAGHAFVRNVCMAFDARLWRRQPTSVMFSDTV